MMAVKRGVDALSTAVSAEWPILVLPTGARRAEELAEGGADPWMRMRGAEVFRIAVEQLVDLSR